MARGVERPWMAVREPYMDVLVGVREPCEFSRVILQAYRSPFGAKMARQRVV